mgnify:CR=1 FL=1
MADLKISAANAATYADVLDCAAKLLAWKAARRRIKETNVDGGLRAAAECIILANEYRGGQL